MLSCDMVLVRAGAPLLSATGLQISNWIDCTGSPGLTSVR